MKITQREEQHIRDIIRRTRTECFGIKFSAWLLQDGFFILGGKNKPVRLMQSKTGDSRNGELIAEYPACYDKAYVYALISETLESAAQANDKILAMAKTTAIMQSGGIRI